MPTPPGPRTVWSAAVYLDAPFPVPAGRAPDFLLSPLRFRRWPWQPHTLADPFLFAHDGALFLFFESQVADDFPRLEVARIDDRGLHRLGNILPEPFHLSYPVVFRDRGDIYLLPETQGAGGLRLYRFARFPTRLEFVRTLLPGRFADPSPVHVDGLWYVFVTTDRGLELYFTDDLVETDLKPHPANPITAALDARRCGGLPFRQDGMLIRPAQDSQRRYGGNLNLMRIERITPTEYLERPYLSQVVGYDHAWNAAGGHHVSIAAHAGGQAVAVDGQAFEFVGQKILRRAWMLATGRSRR